MHSSWTPRVGGTGPVLGDLDETRILESLASHWALAPADVGVGDDAAVLPQASGRVVVTTDSMVHGLDWRDDWSSPADVGRKVIAQNIADVHAMGARPTGVVVALAAEPSTQLEWAVELTRGMADELRRAGTGVLGGDLSAIPSGVVITVTALGMLPPNREPMLRSHAAVGDLLVVSDALGRSHAGLLWLLNAESPFEPHGRSVQACVDFHRAPAVRYEAVDEAVAAHMTCLIDVSDGLLRDAGRIAAASSVCLDLDRAALSAMAAPLEPVVAGEALECVLSGGEEHALLGTCAPAHVPRGWHVIGRVVAGSGVCLDGEPALVRGWDHFLS